MPTASRARTELDDRMRGPGGGQRERTPSARASPVRARRHARSACDVLGARSVRASSAIASVRMSCHPHRRHGAVAPSPAGEPMPSEPPARSSGPHGEPLCTDVHCGTTPSPSGIWPSRRMSARRPARWTSGRKIPGRVSRSRWAHGSASLRPMHSPTDREAPADERVQRDAARDDVAARLLPRQVDFVEHLRLDERQLVPASGAAERSASVEVAVAREPAAGDGADRVDRDERLLRIRPRAAGPTTEPDVEPPPYGLVRSEGGGRAARAASPPRSSRRAQRRRSDRATTPDGDPNITTACSSVTGADAAIQ